MHTLLQLEGAQLCVLIEYEHGRMPVWRHFGAPIAAHPLATQWSAAALRRQSPASMDRLDGNPVFPGFGNGLALNPAVRLHHDGASAVQEWVALSYQQQSDSESQTLELVLTNGSDAGVEITLTLRLWHATNVLSLHSTLRNTSSQPVQVDWLAAGCVPAPADLSDVAHFSGQWGHEFQWQRAPLGAAGWQMQNRHGRSSHELPPACFVLAPTTGDHQGEVMAAQLAWSGNHQFALDRCDDGTALLQAGVWLAPGEGCLAAQASVTSPTLHVTWSAGGINGATHNFHQFTRQHVLQWPGGSMRARPVHLNTWEAVYFNHDDATLRELAVRAAAIGVERFVLDDGWFPGRPNDRSGLGDWWPDPQKYPQGLGPLITHVQGLGMEFGLWVEPEMVNPDSDLFRVHPDWALQSAGHALQLGRQQLALDVSRTEVADYLFNKLDALLRDNAIAYLKWDMNRDLAQAEDAQHRMAYASQVPALYALLARLRAAHPAVEIESCASGGGRMDLGILRHTQRFWTSDNNDAVSRVAIQSGAARLFPLEVLGAHVGPAPAHTTGRSQSLPFRCAVALFGHMGVEADVRKLDSADSAVLAQWIGLYKAWRSVLHSGRFDQGTTPNGVWWMAQTPHNALMCVITVTPPNTMHHVPVRLPALQGAGMWRLRLAGSAGQERARGDGASPWLDALRGDGVVLSSDELHHVGLPCPNMNPESALVFSLEKIDSAT